MALRFQAASLSNLGMKRRGWGTPIVSGRESEVNNASRCTLVKPCNLVREYECDGTIFQFTMKQILRGFVPSQKMQGDCSWVTFGAFPPWVSPD